MTTLSSPQGYSIATQADPSTASIISAPRSSSISTSITPSITSTYVTSSLTSTHSTSLSSSSTQHVTTTPTSHSSSSSSLSQTTSATAPAFTYLQLDGNVLLPFDISAVNIAPFDELCPGNDCYRACQDFSLLFNTDSYAYDATDTRLSASNVTSSNQITLFGLCTNIKGLTNTVINNPSSLDQATSFFNNKQEQANATQIPANISMCLYDTCQATRDPKQCRDLCWPDDTQSSGVMDFNQVSKCMRQLCSNDCGLPYANQDVFGVGVLWSYGIQAVFIIAYTIWLALLWLVRKVIEPSSRVRSVAHHLGCANLLQSISQSGTKRHRWANWLLVFGDRVNEAAVSFLLAECFFGASIVVAALRQQPLTIDPLNGYALLSVAITGFLPPIFTLMLLHSQDNRQWFSTIMVIITWLLSTVLFWLLYANLSFMNASNARLAEARNSLFNVPTCGGYSAMSMCQENIGNDPLRYMMEFYNWNKFPGIQTVWLTWVLTTLVFIGLLVIRMIDFWRSSSRASSSGQTKAERAFWITSAILLLFSFIYQLLMYLRYRRMDVIDKHNWTFGQVVALMIWAPVLLDLFFRPGLDHLQRLIKGDDNSGSKEGKKSTRSLSSRGSDNSNKQGQYMPLTHLPSPDPYNSNARYSDAHLPTPHSPV